VLTALPGLAFAVFGAPAVAVARRTGVTGGILLGVTAIAVGLLARSATGSVLPFLALTLLALAGMAMGNVLVPAWIKRHGGSRVTGQMAAYTVTLLIGASASSLLAVPIARIAPGGWRASIGAWGLIAVVAVGFWLVLARRERGDTSDAATGPTSGATRRIVTSPTAVALAVFFGTQAMNAYVQFGWLPQIYRDAGLSAGTAGALLAWISILGIVGGIGMPVLVARTRDLSWLMWAFGIATLAGYVGLLAAPAVAPWLWATLLGLGGFAFTTALVLINARTRDARVTARVSGFSQPAGYLLAGLGPLLVGVLHDVSGRWVEALVFLMASCAVMTAAGLRLARPTYVDDELGRPTRVRW